MNLQPNPSLASQRIEETSEEQDNSMLSKSLCIEESLITSQGDGTGMVE
jgi:hypothetical protein